VEGLRSLYERAELRLWGLLPARLRRRLTTYGIADLLARPQLETRDTAQVTVDDLLDVTSTGSHLDTQPPPPAAPGAAGRGGRFSAPAGRPQDDEQRGEVLRASR
jgi:hypothetical protein